VVEARAAAATVATEKRVAGGGTPCVEERAGDAWKVESISALRVSSVTARDAPASDSGGAGGDRFAMAGECSGERRVEVAR